MRSEWYRANGGRKFGCQGHLVGLASAPMRPFDGIKVDGTTIHRFTLFFPIEFLAQRKN